MQFLFLLVDKAPSDNDVKAGWTAFAVFLFLIAATALLLWSMTRQLKKAKAAREAGVLPSQDDAVNRADTSVNTSADTSADTSDDTVDHS